MRPLCNLKRGGSCVAKPDQIRQTRDLLLRDVLRGNRKMRDKNMLGGSFRPSRMRLPDSAMRHVNRSLATAEQWPRKAREGTKRKGVGSRAPF